jgi:DNA invertase Pin-like site-specific DNA recombinase
VVGDPATDRVELGAQRVFQEQVSSVAERLELAAALDHLRAGDALLVTKLDRLARSTADLLGIIQRIEARGAALRVPGFGEHGRSS